MRTQQAFGVCFTVFAAVLLSLPTLSQAGEDDSLQFFSDDLARLEIDTATSCSHDRVSEAREINSNSTLKRIDTHKALAQKKMSDFNRFLDQPEQVLRAQVEQDLSQVKDSILSAKGQRESFSALERKQAAIALKSLEERGRFLASLRQGLEDRSNGVANPVADDWVKSHVLKTQDKVAQLAEVSDRYQKLRKRTEGCLLSSKPWKLDPISRYANDAFLEKMGQSVGVDSNYADDPTAVTSLPASQPASGSLPSRSDSTGASGTMSGLPPSGPNR